MVQFSVHLVQLSNNRQTETVCVCITDKSKKQVAIILVTSTTTTIFNKFILSQDQVNELKNRRQKLVFGQS